MNNSVFVENNKVELIGTVSSLPAFSHEVYDEIFYLFELDVPRLSEVNDTIKITVSEKFLSNISLELGTKLFIKGQFRSYNNFSNVGNKLILTVFVKDIYIINSFDETTNPNNIKLNGYICKQPIYRTTPFGREITDLLIAVNRSYNKSDYIPCIAWGRNAKFASNLSVGDEIEIDGRIQSRMYQKKISETEIEEKTAFEVSVSKITAPHNTSFDKEIEDKY